MRAPSARLSLLLVYSLLALSTVSAIAFAALSHHAGAHGTKHGTKAAHKHCHATKRGQARRRRSRCSASHGPARHGSASFPATGTSTAPTGSGSASMPGMSSSGASGTGANGGTEATSNEAGGDEAPGRPPSPTRVQITAVEFSYSLSRSTVPAGKMIVEFVNHGQDPHNLTITHAEGKILYAFANTPPGHVSDYPVELEPGTYTLFCSLPEHAMKGMEARLVVE